MTSHYQVCSSSEQNEEPCCVQLVNCVRLFAAPQTVAHQAPLSMGFSRQEYRSGARWRWSDGDGCSSIPGPETLTLIVMREKPALKAAGDPGASPSGCNSHRCGRFVKLPYCLLCPSGGQGNELLEACCSLATLMNKDTQAAWDCLEQQSEALIPPSTLPPEWGETRAAH